jgi:hypothetical protein
MGRVYLERGDHELALDLFRVAFGMHRLFHETDHQENEAMVEANVVRCRYESAKVVVIFYRIPLLLSQRIFQISSSNAISL